MSADRRPPRLAGSERDTVSALLQYQRESLVRKVCDLDEAAARRRLVPSATTPVWLVRHLARAETLWVLGRFAGDHADVYDDEARAEESVAAAVADYRAVWTRVDAVVKEHSLDELATGDDAQPAVNLRWILMHLLEETARHAGHADSLRELLDGQTGR